MLSIYPGVWRIYTPHRGFHLHYPSISVNSLLLLNDILGGHDQDSFGDAVGGRYQVDWDMHVEDVIDRVRRCTGRRTWSELRDALAGRDESGLERHCEAVFELSWSCLWWPWSSECAHALGGLDSPRLEIYLVVTIKPVWICTCGRDQLSSEMHTEAVDEQVWGCTSRPWLS